MLMVENLEWLFEIGMRNALCHFSDDLMVSVLNDKSCMLEYDELESTAVLSFFHAFRQYYSLHVGITKSFPGLSISTHRKQLCMSCKIRRMV